MKAARVLVYLAGPYRDSRGPWFIQKNIREAMDIAAELWAAGIPTLTPHANTALLDGVAPDEVFLDGDLVMLGRCDAIVMTPRWLDSSGARAEHEFALRENIPAFYWPQDRDAIAEFARARGEV